MIRYAAFQNFLWLWLMPAVAAVLVYGVWQRRRAMAVFVGAGSVSRLAGDLSLVRIWMKAACVVAAIGFTVFALTQPQWGTYWSQQRASGRDILVAIDVSRSMLADDVTPSRLERAKADVLDLVAAVEESAGHRLGLIAFAGTASVKCPLTQVTSHFKLVLDGLDTRSVARGGTMIGDCIRAAIDAFDDKTQNFRDLILITDGEDMESFPLDAAAGARDAGITIYTIGLGDSAQGARIPVADKSGRRSYIEHKGEIVWSKLDEDTLKQIAQITGGIYVPAGTRAIDLDRIFRDVIEPKSKRDLGETRRERYYDRFQWFLAPAVFLLVIERFMQSTRRRSAPSRFLFSDAGARGTHGGLDAPAGARPASRPRGRQSVLPSAIVLLVAMILGTAAAPADDAGSLVREGNRLYEQGKFAEAAQRYEQAAQHAPDSPIPLYNQAAALFQSGSFTESAKLYEQARARAPENLRQQINYALGNSHLQQAIGSQAQPDLASQEAKSAAKFYRDAIEGSPTKPGAPDVVDSARHNLELAKRLIRLMEQKQQQQPQPQDQNQEKDSHEKNSQQGQSDQKQSQDTSEDKQQPAPDSGQSPAQEQPSESQDKQSERQGAAASQQLSPEEAADRLRAAMARAQMARARRLGEQDKKAKGLAVEKDW